SAPPALLLCFPHRSPPPPDLPSFPTRRSSDLIMTVCGLAIALVVRWLSKSGDVRVPKRLGPPFQLSETIRFALLVVFIMLASARSEEHTSELQSRFDLVCRLLLEKKKRGV